MFGKRIRNKKLEQSVSYQIYTESSLAAFDLIDYQYTNLKTGIEQDEEKETDLKQVLQGGQKQIFIPKIVTVSEPQYFNDMMTKEVERPEQYVRSDIDAQNQFVLTPPDQEILIEKNIDQKIFDYVFRTEENLGIEHMEKKTVEGLQKYLNQRNFYTKKPYDGNISDLDLSSFNGVDTLDEDTEMNRNLENQKVGQALTIKLPNKNKITNMDGTDRVLNKPNAIKDDIYMNQQFLEDQLLNCKALIPYFQSRYLNSSLCFRRLTSHLRKSRRSEQLVFDRLKRMYREIDLLTELTRMKNEIKVIDRKIIALNTEIIKHVDQFIDYEQPDTTQSIKPERGASSYKKHTDARIKRQKLVNDVEPVDTVTDYPNKRRIPTTETRTHSGNLQYLSFLYKQIYTRYRPKQIPFYKRVLFTELLNDKSKQRELAKALTYKKNQKDAVTNWAIHQLYHPWK